MAGPALIVPTAPKLLDTKDSEEVRKSLLDFAAKVNESLLSERRATNEQLSNADDPYFIMYQDADAHVFALPENAPLKTTYSFMRTVASTNQLSVSTSGGDTVEGATSFVTHGATVASTLNSQIVTITKTGATKWTWTSGEVYAEAGVKKTWRRVDGRHRAEITGTTAANAGLQVSVATGINATKIKNVGGSFAYGNTYCMPFNTLLADGSRPVHVPAYIDGANNLVVFTGVSSNSDCWSKPFTAILDYID